MKPPLPSFIIKSGTVTKNLTLTKGLTKTLTYDRKAETQTNKSSQKYGNMEIHIFDI